MKINTKTLIAKLSETAEKLRKHFSFMTFVAVSILIGFLVVRINILSNQEPAQESVDAKLQEIKRSRVDEKVVKVLEDLEDNNIDTQSIFDKARNNPFSEK